MERVKGIAIGVAFVLASATEAAAGQGRPGVVIHVQNDAGAPAGVLSNAEQIASRIFAAADVSTLWVRGLALPLEPDGDIHLSLILLSGEAEHQMTKDANVGFDVLGLSKHQARRAYIFFLRIDALATGRRLTTPDLLGKIMAHELGHLILPPDSHSLNGIMRANLDLTDVVQRFSREEGTMIHTFLEAAARGSTPPAIDALSAPPSPAFARR